MNTMSFALFVRRRALALSVLAAAFLAATLGLAAQPANAAYKAQVQAGTLRLTGDGASDTPRPPPPAGLAHHTPGRPWRGRDGRLQLRPQHLHRGRRRSR